MNPTSNESFPVPTEGSTQDPGARQSIAACFELFQLSPIPVFLADAKGDVVRANPRGEQLLAKLRPDPSRKNDRQAGCGESAPPGHPSRTALAALLRNSAPPDLAWNTAIQLPAENFTNSQCEDKYLVHSIRLEEGGFLLQLEPVIAPSENHAEWNAFRIAVEESPTTIVITNTAGEIQYANMAFEKSSGYTREEVLGKNPRFLKSGHQPKEFYEQLWQNLREGRTWEGAFQNRRKDGSLYWEQASIGPVHGANQEINGYIAIKQDITQQRLAEERMEQLNLSILQTKRRLEETNALALVGSWELDLEKQEVYLSKVVRRIHEIPEDRHVSLEEAIHFYKEGPSREKIRHAVSQAMELGTPFDVEAEFVTAKGNERWVRAVGLGELVDGNCRRIFGSFQDITAQKTLQIQLEAALAEERRQNRFIADLTDSLPVAVIQRDLEGNVLDCNPAAQALTGYTRDELKLLCLAERDGEELAAIARQEDELLLSGKVKVYRTEREILHKDRRALPVLITKSLIHDDNENPLRIVTVLVDISEAKTLERALRKAKVDADSANRAKSAFLATMSHEIRTPLNAVIGMASLLAETTMEDDQRTYANTILAASHSLLDLINDILDYSKIESRKLVLNKEPFDPAGTLLETLQLFRAPADDKQLTIQCHIDPEIPKSISGDRVRLKQVLLNLVGNAVKFTKAGTVSAMLKLREKSADTCTLEFRIEDTGIGIPDETQPKLFTPFTQADSSTTREFGGTGLGLAISQRIVELMGGRIQVLSRAGEGSAFFFALKFPLTPASNPVHPPVSTHGKPHSSLDALRVLLAEDNENNRTVLRLLLQKLGIRPHVVENGAEAIRAFEEKEFDIVLLDIQMPVMDGITAIQLLKGDGNNQKRNFYSIALTANAFVEDKQQCLDAGFDYYLAKPITLSQLRAGLETAAKSIAQGTSKP